MLEFGSSVNMFSHSASLSLRKHCMLVHVTILFKLLSYLVFA